MPPRPPAPALSQAPLAPGLYVVATPIGNLRDVTLRALDVLAGCDRVLAEDTRVTGKLLATYGIKKPLERHDDHTPEHVRAKLVEAMRAGARLALCSDAGVPLVSDPGLPLVREAIAAGVAVIPAPGASASLAALAAAGLPTDRFLFAGFPPPRPAARRTWLQELKGVRATLVLFEAPARLKASLADMAAVLGERPAAVARELTKLHETHYHGALGTLAAHPELARPKGEIVVVIGPPTDKPPDDADADRALAEALTRLGPAQAAAEVARSLGLDRRSLYSRALALKGTR